MSSPQPIRGAAQAVAARDPDSAFEALVHAHYATLGAFALRQVGSRPAAEDVVQEVLLRVWRRRAEFNFDDPLPYLYQAVRNEVMSWRHREILAGRRDATDIDADDQLDPRPDAQRSVEMSELARVVQEAVQDMPDRRREIFRMQREQGLSYRQIAALLGISVKTVEVQMGRALKTIRMRAAPFLAVALTLLR